MTRPQIDRLLYVDDSGRPQSGIVVFGWIEVSPDRWSDVLGSWIDLRRMLWREYGIPVARELHTTEVVNGRGRVSAHMPLRHVHNGVEFWKDFGREVAELCLDAIRCCAGARVGAVWRRIDPMDLSSAKAATYSALIRRWEAELASANSLGVVLMDGDGSDTSYRAAHRSLKLSDRRVVEDPLHLDSRSSQLIQMADLVAWTAYAHIDRHVSNEFAWNWYANYLAERDPQRGPQELGVESGHS